MEIAVFARGASCHLMPEQKIPRDQAEEWVMLGAARWVNNRYKSIQMIREPANAKLRDASSKMGWRISERAVMGQRHARSLVQEWAGCLVGRVEYAEQFFRDVLVGEIEDQERDQNALYAAEMAA